MIMVLIKMILYTVPIAPNPTKVMLYIAERQIRGFDLGIKEIVVNTLKGKHKEAEHLTRNPFGTLPVLELEDGTFIFESLSIIQYFEECFPEKALLPKKAKERAKALELERITDLRILNEMARYVHATKSPLGFPNNPEKANEAKTRIQPALDYLECSLMDERDFLMGDAVSLADFTLASGCQFLRFIKADLFGNRPKLRSWDERFRNSKSGRLVLKC